MRARQLFTLLSFATMVGASVWVVRTHWPADGAPTLPWLAHGAALGITLFEVLTRALKIQASAWAVDCRLTFGTALRVCLAGDFAAAVTPARSGAEPARFLVLSEAGLSTANRLLVLFLELFLEMWSLALVCLGLAWAFRGHGASTSGLIGLVGGYSGAVLGAGALGLALARWYAHGPPPAWARRVGLHAGRWRVVQRQVRQLRTSVRALRGANVGRMIIAYLASVLHIAGKVAVLPAIVFLADRAFPLTMDTLAPLVLWPLALFYGGVVVPAPGGGGVIEGAFALALGDAIPAGLFAAALLWWRFYTYYVYLLVGGVAAGDTVRRLLARRTSSPAPVHA
ncbi:MAG: flippase-like domain-containing protein [Gemmatimonadaceae bacterium]|jgi:hypothetical protein|nr:flippase-like domain-containing protein [Gemmatimonadaceae bacterium]